MADKARKFRAEARARTNGAMIIARWILFDNHKFTSLCRDPALHCLTFMKTGGNASDRGPEGACQRRQTDLCFDRHLQSRDFVLGKRPTIADLFALRLSVLWRMSSGSSLNHSCVTYAQ
jgi:glutathione S-transferase